jgi:hypothetical protein
MMCHCDLPVKIWVVCKGNRNFGRTFVRCPRSRGEQCEYFMFTDDIPAYMACNYRNYAHARAARSQQGHGAMFNRKLPDGNANVNTVNVEDLRDDDGGMHFRTAEGGKVEFVQNTKGTVLATIVIAADGRSEVAVVLPKETKGDAYAAINAATDEVDEGHIDNLAR